MFAFVDASRRARAADAVARGVRVILASSDSRGSDAHRLVPAARRDDARPGGGARVRAPVDRESRDGRRRALPDADREARCRDDCVDRRRRGVASAGPTPRHPRRSASRSVRRRRVRRRRRRRSQRRRPSGRASTRSARIGRSSLAATASFATGSPRSSSSGARATPGTARTRRRCSLTSIRRGASACGRYRSTDIPIAETRQGETIADALGSWRRALYLGLDASTQHLTLQAIDVDSDAPRLVFEHTTSFDRDLPAYGTRHGILPSDDPRVAVAPPLMWAEALDRAMAAFARSGLERVAGRRGVGIRAAARQRVSERDGRARRSPRSTRRSRSSSRSAASSRARCRRSGSTRARRTSVARSRRRWAARRRSRVSPDRARSSASPGRRFAGSRRRMPAAYGQTARIHLVSSFLASLLAGRARAARSGRRIGHESDGSGARRLGAGRARGDGARSAPRSFRPSCRHRPSSARWRRTGATRYGLPAANVVVWSGDNPCSLIGTGLVDEGRLGISLGTSDTLFGLMRAAAHRRGRHGPRLRRADRRFHGIDGLQQRIARRASACAMRTGWTGRGFSAALAAAPPGNRGATDAALVRAGDHAARAGGRPCGGAASSPATRRRTSAPSSRRR